MPRDVRYGMFIECGLRYFCDGPNNATSGRRQWHNLQQHQSSNLYRRLSYSKTRHRTLWNEFGNAVLGGALSQEVRLLTISMPLMTYFSSPRVLPT